MISIELFENGKVIAHYIHKSKIYKIRFNNKLVCVNKNKLALGK